MTKPNTEPKHSYLNRCIGCSKVKTSSPDKICAACSNKGFTTPIATDPLEDLRDELASILYGDWVTYEMVKLGKVAETTTENIDKIVNILTDREQRARVDELQQVHEQLKSYLGNSNNSRLLGDVEDRLQALQTNNKDIRGEDT